MAIYHCTIKTGGRAKGQSAIAASAYRSGEKLIDRETEIVNDYTRKGGIIYSELLLCENAPKEYLNREVLWNAVHEIEKSSNARLWREIEVALPRELKRDEQIQVCQEYVKTLTDKGMCADMSIHDKGYGNPHCHIMLTTRSIGENGKWTAKSRKVYDLDEKGEKIYQRTDKQGRKQYKSHKEDYNDWNDKERVEEWRKSWADICNKRLSEKINHKSYARQGLIQKPTIHEGYYARKMEKKEKISERCEINREIKEINVQLLNNNIKLEKNKSEINFYKQQQANELTKSLSKNKIKIIYNLKKAIDQFKNLVNNKSNQKSKQSNKKLGTQSKTKKDTLNNVNTNFEPELENPILDKSTQENKTQSNINLINNLSNENPSVNHTTEEKTDLFSLNALKEESKKANDNKIQEYEDTIFSLNGVKSIDLKNTSKIEKNFSKEKSKDEAEL